MPRTAVTGALMVLATLPASRAGFSLSFPSADLTNTTRIGHMLAEVGPIRAKSPARDREELRSRVAHILGVQQGFLSILRGEPPGTPPDGPPPSFEGLKARAETCHAGLGDFAAALRPETLSRAVRIPWFPDP